MDHTGLYLEPAFVLFTVAEIETHPRLLIDVAHEGFVVFDRQDFLDSHLQAVRERMAELGSERHTSSHGHYWFLKPDISKGEMFEL